MTIKSDPKTMIVESICLTQIVPGGISSLDVSSCVCLFFDCALETACLLGIMTKKIWHKIGYQIKRKNLVIKTMAMVEANIIQSVQRRQ